MTTEQWLSDPAHFEEMISDLKILVEIPSVRGEATPSAPFGEKPLEALNTMLSIAQKYGFETKSVENAVGVVRFGQKDTALGILAHLDVVSAGEGWEIPPYTVTRKDGKLIGRGVMDNKGPAIAALYALRAVKECCSPEQLHGVELIFGTDEESGSGDLKLYLKEHSFPEMLFTPDGAFPVINIEKGMLRTTFTHSVPNEPGDLHIEKITGGETVNAVPSKAVAVVSGIAVAELPVEAKKNNVIINITKNNQNNTATITANGKSSHASMPEDGVNALTGLLDFLTMLPLTSPERTAIESLLSLFPHGDFLGTAVGLQTSDKESGPLTQVFSILDWENNSFTGRTDIRFPTSLSLGNVKNTIKTAIENQSFSVTEQLGDEPHKVPEDSPFIKTLLEVYTEETGLPGKCLAIGGGTYVHNTTGGVAFGPNLPGEVSNIHGIGEFILEERLLGDAKIFAKAIMRLCLSKS